MATWADVEALGYTCAISAAGVRCVMGDGVLIYVAEDDQETIDQLANPPLPELTPTVAEPAPAVVVPQLPSTASLADVIAAVNELSGATG